MADSRKNRSAQLGARRKVRNARRELTLSLGQLTSELNSSGVVACAADAVDSNDIQAWLQEQRASPRGLARLML